MAALSREVNVKNITKDATIPQNDVAKVMVSCLIVQYIHGPAFQDTMKPKA